MSPSKTNTQALHLIGIGVATVLAIAAIVLAGAYPPQDLTPERTQRLAHSSHGES